jgi:choline dehydrogenase-like flavoprotein
MFVDARTVAQGISVDTGICIIGAGAAGITLARSLRTAQVPVVLLESGGLEFNATTQELDIGLMTGLRNYPTDVSRLRYFGGTTNHWAGTSRPFEASDFQPQPSIPLSGWPIGLDDLLPYYRKAQDICQLGPFDYSTSYWFQKIEQSPPAFDTTRLRPTIFQISPPTRFGQVYRNDLENEDNVTVYLNASAMDLQANSNASAVERVQVATLEGTSFFIRAKYIILAAGGLENARLLLLSRGVQANGLANTHDVVGRYFMDHPYFPAAGFMVFSAPDPPLPLMILGVKTSAPPVGAFATLADTAKPDGTAGFQVLVQGIRRIIAGVDSLKTVASSFAHLTAPDHLWEHIQNIIRDGDAIADDAYRTVMRSRRSPFLKSGADLPIKAAALDVLLEQVPNPTSRVTLSDEKDALGLNRLALDWQFTDVERRTYQHAIEMAALEFGRLALGRVKIKPLPNDGWPDDLLGANHHIGTTRMSDDPKTGVVDRNCRVHGVNNLYIAGSSVFPTSTFANPTLTITAMSLRLADELRKQTA